MTTGRWCGRLPVHGAAAAMCGEEEASPQWRRGCEAQEQGVEWGPTCGRAERDDNRSGLDQVSNYLPVSKEAVVKNLYSYPYSWIEIHTRIYTRRAHIKTTLK
jgi:hypothetical protein